MPIRVEHQMSPYAVGLAGWQAGQGKYRQRQQKYALDLFQQDRALQQRRADLMDQRAWSQDQREQERQWYEQRDAAEHENRIDEDIMQGIREGKLELTPEAQKELDAIDSGEAVIAKDGGFDQTQTEEFRRKQAERRRQILRGARKATAPDAGEAAEGKWIWLDENNKRVTKDTPGAKPFVANPYGELSPAINNQAEQAAKKAQEAAEKERQAAINDYNKRRFDLWREYVNQNEPREGVTAETGVTGRPAESRAEFENRMWQKAIDDLAKGGFQDPSAAPATPSAPTGQPAAASPNQARPKIIVDENGEPTLQQPRATPGAAAALQDPNTRAMPIPLAPAGGMQPQASNRPFSTENTPVVGEWAGAPMQPPSTPRTPREPQDPAVQVVPYGKPTSEPRSNMPLWEQGANVAGLSPADIGQYQDYEAGASPMSPPTARQQDWAEEAWPSGDPSWRLKQSPQQPVTAQPPTSPRKPMSDADRQRALRLYENGSPAIRAMLKEKYPSIFSVEERYPDQQFGLQTPPVDTTQRQHTQAMRGPQGTGEGVRRDSAGLLGGIEGAGGLAGRNLQQSRGKDRLAPGEIDVVRYGSPEAIQEQRNSTLDERNAYAQQRQQEREMMMRASGVDPAKTTPRAKPSPFDVAGTKAARKAEEIRREEAAAVRGITKGMARNQRLGKTTPAVVAAIRAALSGDREAQKALDERGIQWRT